MKERLFDVDYNRPLSIAERNIVERLECEPEPNSELASFLQSRAGRIQTPRSKRVSGGRRGKDVGRSAGRVKARAKR